MMEFIILGSGSGLPNLDLHLSAIYVHHQGRKLLFDCGEGTSRKLLQHNLTHDELDAIIISHYHPDHISGIFMVLQMLYLEERTKPLHLYLPERSGFFTQIMNSFYTFTERFDYELVIREMDALGQDLPGIEPFPTDHLLGYTDLLKDKKLSNPMQSFAFRITDDTGMLLYTSDLETVACLDSIYSGCHTVIIDGFHPSAESILELQQKDIKRIIITHERSDELIESMNNRQPERIELAKEDQIYTI